jgi:predicted ribosome quality control (RQC) complex YloA/Tae2 family protein
LVGKGAVDNDALTLTVARPHDLWLHARGLQGAHVIIPRERGSELSPDVLLDAAHLAAHFSSARGEASAEIQHAERRHVRKPKGFAPGAVRVDRERVLLLRVEPERLKRLLASEKSP